MFRRSNAALAAGSGVGLFKSTPVVLGFGLNDNPRGQMGRRADPDIANTKAPYGMPRYDMEDLNKPVHMNVGFQTTVCNRHQTELTLLWTMAANAKGGFGTTLFNKHFYYEDGGGTAMCKHCKRAIHDHHNTWRTRHLPFAPAHNTDDNMSQGPMGRDGNSLAHQQNWGVNYAERGLVDPTAARGYFPDLRHLLPFQLNVQFWIDPKKTDKRYIWKGPASQRQSPWWAPADGFLDGQGNSLAPKGARAKMVRANREALLGPTVQGAALARKAAEKEAKRQAHLEAYKKDEALMLEEDAKLQKLLPGGDAVAKIDDALAAQLKEKKYGHALKHVATPVPDYVKADKSMPVAGYTRWLTPKPQMLASDYSGWTKIKL